LAVLLTEQHCCCLIPLFYLYRNLLLNLLFNLSEIDAEPFAKILLLKIVPFTTKKTIIAPALTNIISFELTVLLPKPALFTAVLS
jgi:hypothetical protein